MVDDSRLVALHSELLVLQGAEDLIHEQQTALSQLSADADQAAATIVSLTGQLTTASDQHVVDQQTIADLTAQVADLQAQLAVMQSSYPLVASVQSDTTALFLTNARYCLDTLEFTGIVIYFTPVQGISWDARLAGLKTSHGDQRVDLQITFKTYTEAGLQQIIDNLPADWTAIFNYTQEPELKFTTTLAQKAFRDTYTAMAVVCTRNDVDLPWLELQEYSLQAGRDLTPFIPPTGDFAGILWSLYSYNEKDDLAAQVARIQAGMARYAPGKPWGLMAAGYTLEPVDGPFTDVQLTAQAAWLTKAYTLTKAAGSIVFGWFNLSWPGAGGSSGENRIEKNPDAVAAWREIVG